MASVLLGCLMLFDQYAKSIHSVDGPVAGGAESGYGAKLSSSGAFWKKPDSIPDF